MNAVLRPGEYYRVTLAFEVYSFSNHSQHPALTLERNAFRLIPIHAAWHYAVDNVPHLQMQADMKANNDNENQELLNLIGDDAFTRLCTVFGGTKLHISNSERSRKRLNIIVGEENAAKLIFHFDGVALTLPMLSSLEIRKRHQAIIADAKSGMSHRDIAMKYDLTDRQVRRIINES